MRTRPRRPSPGSRRLPIRWQAVLTTACLAIVLGGGTGAAAWLYYGRLIDTRLGIGRATSPQIYARPVEVTLGSSLTAAQLIAQLNELGFSRRAEARAAREFSVAADAILVVPPAEDGTTPSVVRVEFSRGRVPTVRRLRRDDGSALRQLRLGTPLLASLGRGERHRRVSIARVPGHLIDAVLAIEDRRFYDHAGVDPIRAIGALVTNLGGTRAHLEGGSTVTQQLVKNVFLSPEKTVRRKLQEQFIALIVESRLSKDQILEHYLNEIVLGQQGPFAIRGVGEAARIFFAKDVSNLSVAEAATLAGLIRSPSWLNPFRHPERAVERRNLVLTAMVEDGRLDAEAAAEAREAALTLSAQAIESEAPYFVDYVAGLLGDERRDQGVDVYTTVDLRLQRLAQEAVDDGLARLDRALGERREGKPQAAMVVLDPTTGDILAMVGGRGYSESQFNRATDARRQPGSVFKPFVYLAAFERGMDEGWRGLSPATIVYDEPTEFQTSAGPYTPANYQNQYDGPVTLRVALARSRNNAAVKVAEATGYDRVASLWQRIGVGAQAQPYPSIALGVFEATPLDMATAYTLFANGGRVRPARAILQVVDGDRTEPWPTRRVAPVARPQTSFLVTDMMRSVIEEGTGAGARTAGFTLDAAGKSGTTNDLRDAWFVGFTPDLLAVVWVGFDDNQSLGFGGSQAALPIWTAFMQQALSTRAASRFAVPEGIVFRHIDPETGQLATSRCPRVFPEAFIAGTGPTQTCRLHGRGRSRFRSFFSDLGRTLGRIIR